MIEIFLKISLIVIVVHVFIAFIVDWVKTFDTIDDDYEYCNNCNAGLCMENPRSEKCEKWRLENEDHDKK